MRKKWRIQAGVPFPLGASRLDNGNVNFAAALGTTEECGLILFGEDGQEVRLPFDRLAGNGDVVCMQVSGLEPGRFSYLYYVGESAVTDPYARAFAGGEKWGEENAGKMRCLLPETEFDWEGDKPLGIPYEDSILYLLHVRGFTRHASSKVTHKGTFAGLVEKLPYLKELGITAVELMPCYEFLELERERPRRPGNAKESMAYAKEHFQEAGEGKPPVVNYWGYKRGFYMAPKRSYCAGDDVVTEMKRTVKQLHRAGIEVILQFYFPGQVRQAEILDVIRYWVYTYHIDGVHLLGERIPTAMLATEPLLKGTKLMYYDFPWGEIREGDDAPSGRNLAVYQDNFMYDCRRFLKSDEGMLQAFLGHMRENPARAGIVHYMTNYYGFTLADLVSYDRKHNEANGEDGRDGNEYNASWNCGVEGKSRKKRVQALRLKQMKNALTFLFLAQGTPLLLAGDEFGRTQEGNNNAYCQDNEISWVNWNLQKTNAELFAFTKELIWLRKGHPILHRPEEMKMMDYIACGYPDLSYHGKEAWRLSTDCVSRQAGILYCGSYARVNRNREDDFFYLAYNMYWEEYAFALPELPADREWKLCFCTSKEAQAGKSSAKSLVVAPRSVAVLIGVKKAAGDTESKERSIGKRYEDLAAF